MAFLDSVSRCGWQGVASFGDDPRGVADLRGFRTVDLLAAGPALSQLRSILQGTPEDSPLWATEDLRRQVAGPRR
jgi:hypothetical protein